MTHYQLQLFHGDKMVLNTTVVWLPEGNSHPVVGQTIERDTWRVTAVLDNPTPDVYRLRVEPA
jgi:hypothetical protein